MDGGTAGPARAALHAGVRDMLPMTPALLAWGLVTGVAMAQSGLPLPEVVGLSVLPYAGSAQLAALPLLVARAPIWVTVLAALAVNLRFIIYSAALTPAFRSVRTGRRLLLGYLIGDFSFIVYMRRASSERLAGDHTGYFFGLAYSSYVIWHVASLLGIAAAARIPREWGLEFAGLLALVALLVPMLVTSTALAATAVAALASVLLAGLPVHLGLVAGILAGVAAGFAIDRLKSGRA